MLDNQSTVNVFQNARLLKNIQSSTDHMDIHCNAGVTSTNLVGDLPGYGTVWYYPQGIANILSLSHVKKQGYHVTYDSEDGNAFFVHKPDGSVRVFNESERGLYFMDTSAAGTMLVSTVADNRSRYTNCDYFRAVLAFKLQCIMGRPSMHSYIKLVEKNLLPNCPITCKDILAAEDISGPDISSLKGKTIRRAAGG